MGIDIGRLGSLGLGIEETPGTAVSADVYLPFTEISLRGHHEPIEDIASKTSRLMDKDSVPGQKWSEGDVGINLDVVNSGYLWKLALGNEQLEAGTPNNHTFYVTTSGNTPKTATLIYSRSSTDIEQYVNSAVDELSINVPNDGLATMSASFQGKFPTAGDSQTATTTSGTMVTFKDMSVKFGEDLTAANGASATPVNEFNLTIANNLEVIHRSGDNDVSTIRTKGCRITGGYTVFFDSETDKNAYYNLNKRAMEVTLTGNADEEIRIRIPEFRLNEGEVSTGLDDFYVVSAEFVAEDDVDSGVRLIDVRLQNDKGAVY